MNEWGLTAVLYWTLDFARALLGKVFFDEGDNIVDQVTLPTPKNWYNSVTERRDVWLV